MFAQRTQYSCISTSICTTRSPCIPSGRYLSQQTYPPWCSCQPQALWGTVRPNHRTGLQATSSRPAPIRLGCSSQSRLIRVYHQPCSISHLAHPNRGGLSGPRLISPPAHPLAVTPLPCYNSFSHHRLYYPETLQQTPTSALLPLSQTNAHPQHINSHRSWAKHSTTTQTS